jgi:hypothetical protein
VRDGRCIPFCLIFSETRREDLFKAQKQDEIDAGLSTEIIAQIEERNDDDVGSETSSMILTGGRRASNRVEEMIRKVWSYVLLLGSRR